jgi:hypothetical protein
MCGWERLEYDQDRRIRGLGAQTTGNFDVFRKLFCLLAYELHFDMNCLNYTRSMHVGFTNEISTSK